MLLLGKSIISAGPFAKMATAAAQLFSLEAKGSLRSAYVSTVHVMKCIWIHVTAGAVDCRTALHPAFYVVGFL